MGGRQGSHISLKRAFNLYNRKYFNNELPVDTSVIWCPLHKENGTCTPSLKEIRICTTLMSSPKLMRIILLHEMIHLKSPRLTHGKGFKAEKDRLYTLGAYDDLL